MGEEDQRLNSFSGKAKQAEKKQPENNALSSETLPGDEEKAIAGKELPFGSDDTDTVSNWRQEKQELVEQLQRERANFDNFRRINRQQQENTRVYALCDFFKKLLPVLDDLERAIGSARREEAASSHVQGLEMIYSQLFKLLSQEGVCRIEAEGRCFDPNFHHAVAQVEGKIMPETGEERTRGLETGEPAGGEPGTVAEELTKGYTFKDRILRPSMVKVYK